MSTAPKFALTFSLNVLTHLGIGLYSNIPAVLSELVANAWDAAATTVEITLDVDRIVIADNGRGMTEAEINERFLKIGYQKRLDETMVAVATQRRHVMGRKGIGKLSAFSIANHIMVYTARDGEKNGFAMSLSDIEEAIQNNLTSYSPKQFESADIDITQGTKIVLHHLRQPLDDSEAELRTELARRFTVIGATKQFDVIINGKQISLKDRDYYDKIQFMWYLGAESQGYIQRCPNCLEAHQLTNKFDDLTSYTVTGWIATVTTPSSVSDRHHAISIFAHGKLIQEDMLAEIREARHVKQYLIGEIDADFLDEGEEDIVTSDRQRMNQSDPRYVQLREFVRKRVKEIASKWSGMRKRHKSPKGDNQVYESASVAGVMPTEYDTQFATSPIDSHATSTEIDHQRNIDSVAPQLIGEGECTTPDFQTEISEPSASSQLVDTQADKSQKLPMAPAREAQAMFKSIRTAIERSSIEDAFKAVLFTDLEQARLAYYVQAYKACVVMLGAVIEGMMLATLRRPELVSLMLEGQNRPKQLDSWIGGIGNPDFADRTTFTNAVATKLSFERMRQVLEHYHPELKQLGIVDIQQFRNAVHPWECVTRPDLYAYGPSRALQHLSGLDLLARELLSWTP